MWFQAVLRDSMEKLLPDDIHIRSNGRIRGENIIFSVLSSIRYLFAGLVFESDFSDHSTVL